MKKISVSALALAVAFVAAPVAAHADTTPGWYVGAGAGAVFGQDPEKYTHVAKHSLRDEDVNASENGSGGYAWDNGMRLEGEYFHDQVNVNHQDTLNGQGHVSNNAVFANALYDFNAHNFNMDGTRLTPYVGVGVGPDWVNVKNAGTAGSFLRGDTLVLGYQGIAGVSTQLDQNWAITADYRYISSFDPKVDSSVGGQGRMENTSHNVIVGVRYSFGGEEEQQPMHSATAPTVSSRGSMKPAVASSAQDFMVFFDFNKATLTPEAKRIIASAAQAYKASGAATISITGHTDTVGKAGYNEKLSKQRAAAVEAELKKLGISSRHIAATGVGKDGLLVPTADGVREAQNRRAEIVLSK